MKIQSPKSELSHRIQKGFCNQAQGRVVTIPKGLRPSAQGCEERATLGLKSHTSTTLKGLRLLRRLAWLRFTLAPLACALLFHIVPSAFAQPAVLYENNFEKEQIGKVPEDFLVLDGGFTVKEEAGNKFLELPGSPLDSYSVQFGPTESSNIVVSARIKSTVKGRRFSTFGVGLNGNGGYRLQLSPAKKLLELYKRENSVANVPFEWKSGHWFKFHLQLRATNSSKWIVQGKVWDSESSEPSTWMISYDEKEAPSSGRPSVFASPFAGTPIQFDDLKLERVASK
jgi:hypothetical protein